MKEMWQNFFRNKFNIALLIIQSVSLLSLVLIETSIIFYFVFFVGESAFFVVWGIANIKQNREVYRNTSIYEKLPYATTEISSMKKSAEIEMKNNKLKGVLLILLGIILFFTFMATVL